MYLFVYFQITQDLIPLILWREWMTTGDTSKRWVQGISHSSSVMSGTPSFFIQWTCVFNQLNCIIGVTTLVFFSCYVWVFIHSMLCFRCWIVSLGWWTRQREPWPFSRSGVSGTARSCPCGCADTLRGWTLIWRSDPTTWWLTPSDRQRTASPMSAGGQV